MQSCDKELIRCGSDCIERMRCQMIGMLILNKPFCKNKIALFKSNHFVCTRSVHYKWLKNSGTWCGKIHNFISCKFYLKHIIIIQSGSVVVCRHRLPILNFCWKYYIWLEFKSRTNCVINSYLLRTLFILSLSLRSNEQWAPLCVTLLQTYFNYVSTKVMKILKFKFFFYLKSLIIHVHLLYVYIIYIVLLEYTMYTFLLLVQIAKLNNISKIY